MDDGVNNKTIFPKYVYLAKKEKKIISGLLLLCCLLKEFLFLLSREVCHNHQMVVQAHLRWWSVVMLVYVVEEGVEHVCEEGMVCDGIVSEEKSEVGAIWAGVVNWIHVWFVR